MNVSLVIKIIIVLAFFQGVWSYIGLPPFYFRAILEIFILILFISFIHFILLRKDKSFISPGLIFFLIFTFSVFTSALINNSDLFLSIKMYNRILFPYLFFLSILNINLSDKSIQSINKLIIILVILQIPAAIYKYIKYDVVEGIIIGTFSIESGTLSTIFPVFVIGYLIAFYFCHKKNKLLLLLSLGFMFFSWGGGKRAFFLFLPGILFIAYIIYNTSLRQYKLNVLRMIPAFVLILFIISAVVYFGARINPIFNPERERWGSFDFSYMVTQARDYQSMQIDGRPAGRFSTFELVFSEILINGELQQKLSGDGPDIIEADRSGGYGIVYGISGITFMLVSTGLVGVMSFFSFFFLFGIKAYKSIRNFKDPFYIAISFGTILAVGLFCFDFLFYSSAFFNAYIITLLFFYASALFFKQDIYLNSRMSDLN